jgi:hypothetical protein
MIPQHAMKNFIINENDDKMTILLKNYYLSKDDIGKKINAENNVKDFNDKYNKIMKMRNKTSIDNLKILLAVESLLNE